MPKHKLNRDLLLERIREIDWCFPSFKTSTGLYHIDEVFNTHWYPGRCISPLPASLASILTEPGQVLLDPFVGSGTIITAAQQCGLTSIGFDINPIAQIMSKVKTSLLAPMQLEKFKEEFTKTIKFSQKNYNLNKNNEEIYIPNPEENSLWYHHETLKQLGTIFYNIDSIDNCELRAIAFSCFSSSLRACCSQKNHWGYICDNMLPKEHFKKNVFDIFTKRFQQYILVLQNHYKYVRDNFNNDHFTKMEKSSKVINDSSLNIGQYLEEKSIDIVITSPPYPGVNDYVNSQRLSLLWLEDWKNIQNVARNREIGARWKRFRKNSSSEFLNDISTSLIEVEKVLKAGSYLCLIYGESKSRPSGINEIISEASKLGINHIFQIDRSISKKRALAPQIMNESIYIFQKQ